MTRVNPDQAYRDAPPQPAELGEVMRGLAEWIEGKLTPAGVREHKLRAAAAADRSALLAADEVTHYKGQRTAAAREVRALVGETRESAEEAAAALIEHDRQHRTALAEPAGLTGRDYVRAEYLAWQTKENAR
ncbi:hypothetical protein ACGF07_32025 [Kitasatospora sp. NPDC048194]|uniref:hypothetical protein n=1 Tax=Kitasatospora sp. NPDC048194 TaxID=3364045 RepID=UPI003714367E